ncbi:MAG: hypothetical protein WDM78_23135 [Puia sp.]
MQLPPSVFSILILNRPEIPIGIVRGDAVELGDKQHWTDSVISRYPHKIRTNGEAEDALDLYRKILAISTRSFRHHYYGRLPD